MPKLVPSLAGLNRDEGGALIFRLLSETGVIGTVTFLLGCAWACLVGVRACRACRQLPGGAEVAPVLAAITGTWLTILVLYLSRFGAYFSPVFWTSLAFVIVLSDWVLETQNAQCAAPARGASTALASDPT